MSVTRTSTPRRARRTRGKTVSFEMSRVVSASLKSQVAKPSTRAQAKEIASGSAAEEEEGEGQAEEEEEEKGDAEKEEEEEEGNEDNGSRGEEVPSQGKQPKKRTEDEGGDAEQLRRTLKKARFPAAQPPLSRTPAPPRTQGRTNDGGAPRTPPRSPATTRKEAMEKQRVDREMQRKDLQLKSLEERMRATEAQNRELKKKVQTQKGQQVS
jgi:hypothetical protein